MKPTMTMRIQLLMRVPPWLAGGHAAAGRVRVPAPGRIASSRRDGRRTAKTSSISVPPALEVGRDEGVVVQLGIGGVEASDAGALARTQRLVRVEAFDRGHQPLAPQDLVTARDAAGEVVVDIEYHRVAVGDERVERQYLRRNGTGRHG